MFSSCQTENVTTLTNHERVILEQWFLAFSFEQETVLSNVIAKFVKLIVISIVEKILNLFPWLFDAIRFEQGDGILLVQLFWLAGFLELTNIWRIELLIEFKQNFASISSLRFLE